MSCCILLELLSTPYSACLTMLLQKLIWWFSPITWVFLLAPSSYFSLGLSALRNCSGAPAFIGFICSHITVFVISGECNWAWRYWRPLQWGNHVQEELWSRHQRDLFRDVPRSYKGQPQLLFDLRKWKSCRPHARQFATQWCPQMAQLCKNAKVSSLLFVVHFNTLGSVVCLVIWDPISY